MDEEKEIAVKYTGELSDEAHGRFLAVHKKMHRLEVPVTDDYSEIAVAYLKPIGRTFMSGLLATDDKISRWELMLSELWIAGDERIKTDDDLFYSAGLSLNSLLSFKLSRIKKNYLIQSNSQSTTAKI